MSIDVVSLISAILFLFLTVSQIVSPIFFTSGTTNALPHWASVECLGNETHLINCSRQSAMNCVQSEDVGLICKQTNPGIVPIFYNIIVFVSICSTSCSLLCIELLLFQVFSGILNSMYVPNYVLLGTECENDMVRILDIDERNSTAGRVEVCVGGRWGSICETGSGWDGEDARVICQQVGHAVNGKFILILD